ncbi:MAG: nucleoside 2-deoxyribosyltransferase [Deltaproteobacteria bacterium]|nr:nucleoside 2-deoxyribosyltransferase [Deltaproteobacteria bacterium]
MKLYLAGPIFTAAEQDWLLRLKGRIGGLAASSGEPVQVIWPYELIDRETALSLGNQAKFEIFKLCKTDLDDTDILIAWLDGTQVDDGTAWEVGYFYARRHGDLQLILGLRTDFRRAGESAESIVNAMIECSCDRLFHSADGLLEYLQGVIESGDH